MAGIEDRFVARYSFWKVFILEAFIITIAVCPLLPGFSTGLRYTAIFFTPVLFPFMVACCLTLGLLAVLFLRVVWRALARLPAVEIEGDRVRVYVMRFGEFTAPCVRSEPKWEAGNLVVRTNDGSRIPISVALLRDRDETLKRLGALRMGRPKVCPPGAADI
jgi:hypothetical protein